MALISLGVTIFFYFVGRAVTGWLFSPRFGRYFGFLLALLVAALTFGSLRT